MPNASHSMFASLLLALGVAGVPSVVQARPPAPGNFQISPVRVELTAEQRTSVLTLRSGERESARFQVTAHVWTQGPGGEVQLAPTRDVSFFPSLFELEPGASRQIRVGVAQPAEGTERTYRILIEQLPSMARTESPSTVQVLTRLSIPVFVTPRQGGPAGRLEDVRVERGRLGYVLRNAGERHLVSRPLRVTGRDASGRTLLEREQPGWYVLAGDFRRYELDLPAGVCRRLRSLVIETEAGTDVLSATAPVRPVDCVGR